MPSLTRAERTESEKCKKEIQSSPLKMRLRSSSTRTPVDQSPNSTPLNLSPSTEKWKSPRRSNNSNPNSECPIGVSDESEIRHTKSARRKLTDCFIQKPKWNPEDSAQMSVVKEALHVSMTPSCVVCREEEQERVLEFCKGCIQEEKASSLYVCGSPCTGKTLSMEKVKYNLLDWVKESGFDQPTILSINCTSLGKTSDIFTKILDSYQPRKKVNGACEALEHLQKLFSQKKQTSKKMMIVVADELDYLITKDRSVLDDFFMLTTLPFSKCVLIGIANALDLADRFLSKLEALNCKPLVVTFRAYSKDETLKILQLRLAALTFDVFDPQALELCARKVPAAASGDMRKALCVCRSAIEILESELRRRDPCTTSETNILLRVDHMALALSRTFKSSIVDTIQSLPQHQQIVICSMMKLFRGSKKDTTLGELNKSYIHLCKSSQIPPAGFVEFSIMCRILNDQGILKMDDRRTKQITLKIDEANVTFALQGIRFFRNCLLLN